MARVSSCAPRPRLAGPHTPTVAPHPHHHHTAPLSLSGEVADKG